MNKVKIKQRIQENMEINDYQQLLEHWLGGGGWGSHVFLVPVSKPLCRSVKYNMFQHISEAAESSLC